MKFNFLIYLYLMSKRKTRKNQKSRNIRKRVRKKTRKWSREKCSPKKKNEILKFSCYTAKGLHKLKNIWNKKHPDRKIKSNDAKKYGNLSNIFYHKLVIRSLVG